MPREIAFAAAIGASLAMAHRKEPEVKDDVTSKDELQIPRKLSIELDSPHYHPCYSRVGVRVDGEERNDIAFFDLDQKSYMTTDKSSHLANTIEPYWRWPETRQIRRQRERWEAKHERALK